MEGASLAAVQHDETFGDLLDLTVKSELIMLFKQHVKMIIYSCLVCILFPAERVIDLHLSFAFILYRINH